MEKIQAQAEENVLFFHPEDGLTRSSGVGEVGLFAVFFQDGQLQEEDEREQQNEPVLPRQGRQGLLHGGVEQEVVEGHKQVSEKENETKRKTKMKTSTSSPSLFASHGDEHVHDEQKKNKNAEHSYSSSAHHADEEKILNWCCGSFQRMKKAGSNEGGICAGHGYLDVFPP